MAVARSSRNTPPYYALITLVFLWVVSSILAGFFYVQGGKDVAATTKDIALLNTIATRDERTVTASNLIAASKTHLAIGSRQTVTALGEAMFQINALTQKLAGTGAAASVDELTRKDGSFDQLLANVGVKDVYNASDAVRQLADERTAAKTLADQKTAELAAAQATYAKAVDDQSKTLQAYKKSIDERSADVKQLNDQIIALHAQEDANNQKAQAELVDLRNKQEAQIRSFVTQLQEAKDNLAKKDDQLAQAQKDLNFLKTPPKIALGTASAGKVLRVGADNREVWVNLGRRDHVAPGMTFAVYDPKFGISFDTNAKGKKGDVEIVDVGEHEAMARITHTEPNQLLAPDDLIGSLVYSKNRKFHFYVYGNFDLDNDSLSTPAERSRIIQLIQTWGGIVDDKFSTQTDFLILGTPPTPPASNFEPSSDEAADLAKQRDADAKQYASLIAAAKDFAVPVLDANKFLSMIGYYNPTVVK